MQEGFFNIILPREDKDVVTILLYGVIGGEDKDIDCAQSVAAIKDLETRYHNIDVHINSLGGDVYGGLAIFNALRESEANVNIYVDGVAASMAAVIALCGKPLHMSRYSRLMLHTVSGAVRGSAKVMRSYAEQIDALTDMLATIVAERMSLSVDEVKARFFDGSDHWLSAQEALDLRLADSIYDMPDGAMPEKGATAEAIYEFTNRLNSQPQIKNNMVILEELRKMSSFENVTTEEQAVATVASLANEAAKVPALEARLEVLEKEKTEATAKARNAYLDQAVADGRIQESMKAQYLALMAHDEAGVKAVIDSMPKGAGKISAFINQGGAQAQTARAKFEAMSWDEMDKANLLMECKNLCPDVYEAKFNETFKK